MKYTQDDIKRFIKFATQEAGPSCEDEWFQAIEKDLLRIFNSNDSLRKAVELLERTKHLLAACEIITPLAGAIEQFLENKGGE